MIPICRTAGDLLGAEILILAGAIKDHVTAAQAESGCELRDTDFAIREVAEHLVSRAGHLVTRDAAGFPEEQGGAAFLFGRHGTDLTACESIERRVGED